MSELAIDSALGFAERSPEATRTRLLRWQDPLASAAAGLELSGIDHLRAIVDGRIPPPPIAVTMRMAPIEVEAGRVIFAGEPGEEHYNPIGSVHGGYAATLLDSALGCAVQSTLPAGSGYATVSLELKYLRPMTHETGRVLATAEVVHRGRTHATAEGRITDESGRIHATATTTCLIIGG